MNKLNGKDKFYREDSLIKTVFSKYEWLLLL